MNTSTPINTYTKKRALSSPAEELDLKKPFPSESSDSLPPLSEPDISDIPTSVAMDANENVTMDTGLVSTDPNARVELGSVPNIPLDSEHCRLIAEALKESFRDEFRSMLTDLIKDHTKVLVHSIVDGVVDGLTSRIVSLENKNKALAEENETLKKRLETLESSIEGQEQYSRRNCLRISGVSEAQAPNTVDFVIKMCSDLNLNVTLNDIDRSHRVGKPGGPKPRSIIVKFATYRTRQSVFKARSRLRHVGYDRVFINEDLTKSRNALFFRARQLVKSRKIQSAWTSDGTILVKDRNESVSRIMCEADLNKLN